MDSDDKKDDSFAWLNDGYKHVRGQIEHENLLIGHRITWFLAFQGLLFAAFFVAIGLQDTARHFSAWQRALIGFGTVLVCVLGFASSLVCAKLVELAYGQVGRVTRWWQRKADTRRDEYPPLYGLEAPGDETTQPAAGAEKFLHAIGVMWVLLALVAVAVTAVSVGTK